MSKQVATTSSSHFENAMTLSKDYAQQIMEAAAGTQSAEHAYLKFVKGEWLYGREAEELEESDVLAVNPASFAIGWQGWEDGSPINGPVVPMSKASELPSESSLDPIPKDDKGKNGWDTFMGVQLKLVEDDSQLLYNTSTRGGKDFMTDLMNEWAVGMQAHPSAPYPLITLGVDSYMSKDFGKILIPTFKIVGWANTKGKRLKKYDA